MNSTKKRARIAGLLYLLASIIGFPGLIYVPGKLIVSEDATATANHIRASETLLRFGIASELTSFIIFIFVVLALYRLFKTVSEKYAVAMATLLLVSIPISLLNVLNEIAALVLVSGAGFLSAFEKGQLDALAYLFLRLHGQGSGICRCGNLLGALAISVRGSCHSIRFHPPLLGRPAVHCRFRVSGQFLHFPPSAIVPASC